MEAVELDPVQEQLEGTLANLGEELIVACPVSERARKRQRGKAKKLAVLALTVDAKSQARVHQFNRVAEDNVAQVPKLTQLLSHLTRIVDDDDAGDDAGAFELHFEGIQASKRHKSGIAVRFPRIARWRTDKPLEEADTLDNVKALLPPNERAGLG